jgi:flagellar basal-body rod protein FlgC
VINHENTRQCVWHCRHRPQFPTGAHEHHCFELGQRIHSGQNRSRSISRQTDDPTPIRSIYDPGNPSADEKGYVYLSNVNEMQEMVEMMAASRSYQNNVEVVNTARQLMMRTLDITKT